MTAPRTSVTGFYAGPVARLLAALVDWAIIGFVFAMILAGLNFLVDRVLGLDVTFSATTTTALYVIGFLFWAFIYLSLSVTLVGRGFGKWLVGLRVVTREGNPPSGRQAMVRAVTYPLSFLFFGLGFLGIIIGRERRALHDVIAGTAVVYDWGDRKAELPTPLSKWLARKGAEDAIERVAAHDERTALSRE